MAFDHVRFDHGFQIHLVPVLRGLFEHRIQVLGIRQDLARCFGPCSRMPAKTMTGCPVTLSWILAMIA